MTVCPNSQKYDKCKDSRITIKIDEKWNMPERDRLGPEGEGWATDLERLYKESRSRRKRDPRI